MLDVFYSLKGAWMKIILTQTVKST